MYLHSKEKLSHASAWYGSVQTHPCLCTHSFLCPGTRSCLGRHAESMRLGSHSGGDASRGLQTSFWTKGFLSSSLWRWQLSQECSTVPFELCPWSPEEERSHTWRPGLRAKQLQRNKQGSISSWVNSMEREDERLWSWKGGMKLSQAWI